MNASGLLLAVIVTPLSLPLQEGAAKATLGQIVPEHTFPAFAAGGDGRQELREFRGQPVLIVNWTDSDFGRGGAKEAEKLAKELAPVGLVLLLHDTHNRSALEIEASVMRLYPGSPARLARNQKLPIEYLDNGPPPDIALIGVDGTLLVAGSYTADMNRAAKLVKAELKRSKEGWGASAAARTARALAHGKGELGAARVALETALQAAPDDAELVAVQAEIAARFDARVRAVSHFLEHGQPLRAQEEAGALLRAARGVADWEARAEALSQELAGAELALELELDRKLTALLQPLAKKAPEREGEKLRKFAAEAGDTRVGKRALHLAEVVALATGK